MAAPTDDDYADAERWIETSGSHYAVLPSGIVVGVVKPVHYTEAHAHEDFEKQTPLYQAGISQPILIDGRGIMGMDRASRMFWAREPKVLERNAAVGVLVDSALSRMVVNLYVRLTGSPVPTRMFTEAGPALEWLEQFVRRD